MATAGIRIGMKHWEKLMLAGAAFAACAHAQTGPTAAQNAPSPFTGPPPAQIEQQLQAAQKQLLPRTPAEAKLNSNLRLAVRGYERNRPGAPPRLLRPYLALPGQTPSPSGEVVIIQGDITPALHDFVVSQGGSEIAEIPEYHTMSVRLPLQNVLAVASRPDVHGLALARKPLVNQVAPSANLPHSDLDGDAAHEMQYVRGFLHQDGTGQKVCVISDGAGSLDRSQAMGTLPAVDVVPQIPGQAYWSGKQEGTAMLEIVHQIAPGAQLGFADEGESRIMMAANIRRLIDRNCSIIVDDITYTDETPFQDGEISRAARAATEKGILYFSSASNSGNKGLGKSGTWEGDFHGSGHTVTLPYFNSRTNSVVNQVYEFHDFGGGSIFNEVTGANQEAPFADLSWNDPVYPDVKPQNFQLNDYLLAAFGYDGQIVALSSSRDNLNQLPLQTVSIQPGYRLAVLKNQSSQARVVRVATNRGRLVIQTDGETFGHNALGAPNAFSVAAVSVAKVTNQGKTGPFRTNGNDRQQSNLDVNDYSSDGPRRIYYDALGQVLSPGHLTYGTGTMLNKPDFAAADCVTTLVPGFASFCGTSAAAPHAAAIAAVFRSVMPQLDIRKTFVDPALILNDMTGQNSVLGANTWSDRAGYGLLNPVLALPYALDLQNTWIENFQELAPSSTVSDSNHRCNVTAASGGATPVSGGGWETKAGSVTILCKDVVYKGTYQSAWGFSTLSFFSIFQPVVKNQYMWQATFTKYKSGTTQKLGDVTTLVMASDPTGRIEYRQSDLNLPDQEPKFDLEIVVSGQKTWAGPPSPPVGWGNGDFILRHFKVQVGTEQFCTYPLCSR